MSKIKSIFKKENNILIGAVHFPPLPGCLGFPGFTLAEKNALADLKVFQDQKFDGVIFENNYDLPHTEFVSPATVAAMTMLGAKLCVAARLPLGVSVLWNDYRAGLGISKALGLQFVRVPVFVDTVRTNYGVISGKAAEVIKFRKNLKADNVAIFADIHVKHAELLSRHSLAQSARMAIKQGADAIILTGNWTGQVPAIKELAEVRKAVKNFPILVGSGADSGNIKEVLKYANGVIVSTSLKHGTSRKKQVNVKSYAQRIDPKKARAFVVAAL
jgi:hypothetical protein